MSDIAILKEIIKTSATESIENNYTKKTVILKESSNQDKYSVTINGMPDEDQVIIIKVDNFKAPKEIFNNSKHECKRADYVIIADTEPHTNKGKFIICIEMKAGKGEQKEIIQQLQGAQCFVYYCQKIGQVFWDKKDFLNNYHYRFVSIKNISIPVRPSRNPSSNSIHDCPQRMLKISSPNRLEFKSLL
jgi:hypothetical protein